MKLMTINTHSLIEPDYENKCRIFAEYVSRTKPDIIAMQEVDQSLDAEIIKNSSQNFLGKIPLRCDNHAVKISELLSEYGINYNFCWLGIKCGYGKYDEGLAIFSRNPITQKKEFLISKKDDYSDWRTRKILLIKSGGTWYGNVHIGWWEDEQDPFANQWARLTEGLKEFSDEPIFLMGDFNSPADQKSQGYSLVLSSGWHDTYSSSCEKDDGYTVGGSIDGWEKLGYNKKRIDYIFTNRKTPVKSSKVVFNGTTEKPISDHYGIIVTL